MPRIVLDELVPEEITFVYKDREYVIDGDIDVDTTFDLIDLLGRFYEAEDGGDQKASRALNKEVERKLLALFQQREPSLEELPFGVIGYRHVLGHVLESLGLQIVTEPEDPPTPRPKSPSRSRRSTGSRR